MTRRNQADLSGYWRLVKTESFEEFLIALGIPWVIRKAAIKFAGSCGSSVELISQDSPSHITITTLNAKGSYNRSYNTSAIVAQTSLDGAACKTSSWWEGKVLKSRTEGSAFGCFESSRLVRGDTMIVRTTIKPPSNSSSSNNNNNNNNNNNTTTTTNNNNNEDEISVFWFFDRMTILEGHLGSVTMGAAHKDTTILKKQLCSDRSRVNRSSAKDMQALRRVLLDFARWATPADNFIEVAPSIIFARSYQAHAAAAAAAMGSSSTPVGRTMSPVLASGGMSKSASAASLSQLTNQDGRSTATRSEIGSGGGASNRPPAPPPPSAAGGLSSSSSRPGLTTAASDAATKGSMASQPSDASLSPHPSHSRGVSGDLLQPQQQQQQQGRMLMAPPHHHARSPSADSVSSDVLNAPTSGGSGGNHSLSFSHPHPFHSQHNKNTIHPNMSGGHINYTGTYNQSTAAARTTPRSSSPTTTHPPTGGEALMAYKLREFIEGRGISSVIPVSQPNDTQEPELLEMSPEQAEETAVKLRELEHELMLTRQESARGRVMCCGFVLSRQSSTLPDHLRVWEMSLV